MTINTHKDGYIDIDTITSKGKDIHINFKIELDVFLRKWFDSKSNDDGDAARKVLTAIDKGTCNTSMMPNSISTTSHSDLSSDDSEQKENLINATMNITMNSMNTTEDSETNKPPLYEEDLIIFFAWAFFEKHPDDIVPWEKEEMDKMFDILRKDYGVQYPKVPAPASLSANASMNTKRTSVASWRMNARSMTLEDVEAWHRPLLVYICIWILKHVGYVVLLYFGFRRHVIKLDANEKESDSANAMLETNATGSNSKLCYWYLPGGDINSNMSQSQQQPQHRNPILFFHGIAPGGLVFYLPMLINCLVASTSKIQQQPLFLFENPSISISMTFDAPSEEEAVQMVERALHRHGFGGTSSDSGGQGQEQKQGQNQSDITISGHSFGSFQVTWLIKSENIRKRIRKIVLLDPVSILLSEPDVIMNFVYDGGNAKYKRNSDFSVENVQRMVTKLVAGSELCIQHYLRRHFEWYNSELWLEDIPDQAIVHIMLAEKDVIVNAPKVMSEIHRHSKATSINSIYWEECGHGDCITNKELWATVAAAFKSRPKRD
eukprot:CAMPEP_0194122410 /NCGR_PEP_ID=MMETSP0150-20130528/50568_1 /TAXON_ID=122233 /ORGANISM="Chaetoceros debilis, Strain MM31A-1" /LENGTH=547 /DNA_ID=CAMNT_0038815265 /DNA_START=197 /DNA_END=1840 /DNA_ORIENTATION=+